MQGDLCKKVEDSTSRRLDNTTRLSPSNWTTTNTDGLLSDPGQRGLAAAGRSAHTMALAVCQATQGTTLWLQLLPTVANIGVNIQAYDVMQETRRKYPDRCSSAQRAAIALRDVLTLLTVNEYETFDEALLDIASLTNLPMEAMPLLRSQVLLSRTSMNGMAQRTTDIEN